VGCPRQILHLRPECWAVATAEYGDFVFGQRAQRTPGKLAVDSAKFQARASAEIRSPAWRAARPNANYCFGSAAEVPGQAQVWSRAASDCSETQACATA